ncbi:MAG: heparan-alpha-glucosaminide N-acetyltransferase [Candidatus Devosia phytovorans]|uniref:Heparan-alpha-glucosaminide N-acetyltransferase n=1 Tax=Candidatus Devosia phytovorans TaxID=3121372 RepID=A0AAJ6B0L3_9HYPH|nr:heparan-alpha-glucosaminide N-acetyltransferase [Devosia sp.]WEK03608.1 MAG: heparan-alpha-glucosaminide N-acetyltransferase [Devosia sp.]
MTDVVKRPRFAVVDIARGVAIIAMVAYHFCWDLSYFRFIAADVGYDQNWVIIARTILAAFLFLVGVGLVLGHGNGIRWRSFWRRWAFLAAGALIITVATYFAFPVSFVYFGVLHAIALFSLLGLAFVRAPLWLLIIAALAFILPTFFFSHALFNEKQWSWLGFWQIPPPTNDLVPVFPWFGAVLIGIIAMRLVLASSLATKLAAIAPTGRLPRLLAFLGRWSLLIYLLHQPILLGLVYPAAQILQPQLAMRDPDFLRSCQSSCEAGGTSADMCVTYCQCGLEGVKTNDLWSAIETGMVSADEQALLDAQNRQCSALIYPELNVTP